MEYWKSLIDRHALALKQNGSDEALQYQLIGHNIDGVMESLLEREEYEDAKLVKVLSESRVYKDISKDCKPAEAPESGKVPPAGPLTEGTRRVLREIAHREAEELFNSGHIILAACAELAVNSAEAAVRILLRGNELFLAYAVTQILKAPCMDEVMQLIGLRAERLGLFAQAARCYKSCGNTKLLQLFGVRRDVDCAIYGGQPKSEYEKFLKDATGGEAVLYHVLSGNVDIAATLGAERLTSKARLSV